MPEISVIGGADYIVAYPTLQPTPPRAWNEHALVHSLYWFTN